MKQILSKEQVNVNLDRIKKGHAVCYSINYNRYTNEPTFYIWFRGKGITVIQGKKVYWRSFKYGADEFSLITANFHGMIFAPYVPAKTYRNQPKDETAEKLLLACGMKNEKKISEVKPEQRLKELQCGNLVPIYKLIMEVELISADLEIKTLEGKDYWGNVKSSEPYMALVVKHSHGSFSIPIENIAPDQEHTEEIQNIFFNALNLPVTSKLKTA